MFLFGAKKCNFQTLWINTRLIHVITEEIPLTKKIGTEHKIDTHKIQSFLRDFEDAPLTHSYVISDLSHVSHFLRLL